MTHHDDDEPDDGCWLEPQPNDDARVMTLRNQLSDSFNEAVNHEDLPARIVLMTLLEMAADAFAAATCVAKDSPDEFVIHQLVLVRTFIQCSLNSTLEMKHITVTH